MKIDGTMLAGASGAEVVALMKAKTKSVSLLVKHQVMIVDAYTANVLIAAIFLPV